LPDRSDHITLDVSMDTSTIIGLLATLAVVWVFIRPSTSEQRQKAKPRAASPQAKAKGVAHGGPFAWPNLGDFDFEVVGESHYQRNLASLAGEHDEYGARTECVAHLVPEDHNPHDPKAVAVQIAGRIVGYLSREDARSFRRRLGQKGLSGRVTTCGACIVGGATRNGEKLFYGVNLDLKPFE
jgi:hypothetical protein